MRDSISLGARSFALASQASHFNLFKLVIFFLRHSVKVCFDQHGILSSFFKLKLIFDEHDATAQMSSLFGFAAVREYASSVSGEIGDIDSGPVLFGLGFSATGIQLANCKTFGDHKNFLKIYPSTTMIGTPWKDNKSWKYVCGGPLGNAFMLAILTVGEKS